MKRRKREHWTWTNQHILLLNTVSVCFFLFVYLSSSVWKKHFATWPEAELHCYVTEDKTEKQWLLVVFKPRQHVQYG